MKRITFILIAFLLTSFISNVLAAIIYQSSNNCRMQVNKYSYAFYNGVHYLVWSNGDSDGRFSGSEYDGWVKLSKSSDGVNWTTENIIKTAYGSNDHTILIDNNGVIHIAYNEQTANTATYGGAFMNMVYANNKSGQWATVTLKQAIGSYGGQPYGFYSPRLFVQGKDNIIRLFYNQTGWYRYGGPLYVMKYNGTSWGAEITVSDNGVINGVDDSENVLNAYDFENNDLVLYVSSGWNYDNGSSTFSYRNKIFKYVENGNSYNLTQTMDNIREIDVYNKNILTINGNTDSVFYNNKFIFKYTGGTFSNVSLDENNKIYSFVNYIDDLYNTYFFEASNNVFTLVDSQPEKWGFVKNGIEFLATSNSLEANLVKKLNLKTNLASNITCTSATLNGYVNPNNLQTTVTFEYGTTTAYGKTIFAKQSPVSGSNNIDITADITDLAEGTTYHYRVKSVNSNETLYGEDMTFTTKNAPAQFSLSSPANGSNAGTLPKFYWNNSSDATFYQLYIDKKLVKDSIYSTSYQLTEQQALKSGTHTWYIVAYNSCETKSNETWSIKVDATPPNVFNLVSPADNKWTANAKPELKWSASADAGSGLAKYQLWIDDKLFKDNIAADLTSFTPTSDLSNGSHTWFVKAIDNTANEKQSSQTWTIKIDNLPPGKFASNTSNLYFNGSNSYVKTKSGIYFNGNFTIEAWVYPINFNSWSRIIDFGNGSPNNNVAFCLSNSTTGKPNLTIYNGSNYTQLNFPNALTKNVWTHIAVTLSGNLATAYVNGQAVTTQSSMNIPQNVTRNYCYIGKSNWSQDPYVNSNFDEIRIWDYVRTQEQINTFKSIPLSGMETGLVAYWRFDENSGSIAYDYTNNHNDGTIYGGATYQANNIVNIYSLCNLKKPDNNTYTQNAKPQFSWSSTTDAGIGFQKFQLYIDDILIKDNLIDSTFTLTDSLLYGSHNWYIKGFDSLENNQASVTRKFNIDNAPPMKFSLKSPADSAILDLPTPDLSWNATQDSANGIGLSKYQLVINKKIDKDSIPTSKTTTSPKDALDQGAYTWYVIAFDKLGNIKQSNQQIFYIDYEPPMEFTLISPADNETVELCRPVFKWNSSSDLGSGLIRYEFTLSGFDVIKLPPTDTTLSFPQNVPDGDYTWFVKAFDRAGAETASNIHNLKIKSGKIYTIDGFVTYDNTANTPLKDMSLTLKDAEGNKITTTNTDDKGYYKFEKLSNGTYTIEGFSDKTVNGVDPIDALFVNRYYLKIIKLSSELKKKAADVNADNSITPIDALFINRYYLKLVKDFKPGKWLFKNPTVNVSCDNATQNIKAICTGDVNASYKP